MRAPKLAFSLAAAHLNIDAARIDVESQRRNLSPSFRAPGFASNSAPARPNPWPGTFQELVCEQFDCSPADYAKTVFARSVKPGRRWLARALFALCPAWFEIDIFTLNNLARDSNDREFERTLREYQRLCALYRHSLRFLLELRLSCRELAALKNTLLGKSTPGRIGQKQEEPKNTRTEAVAA